MDSTADIINDNCNCAGVPQYIKVGSILGIIGFTMSLINLALHMARRRNTAHHTSRV